MEGLKNLSLGKRLIIAFLFVGIIPFAVNSYIAATSAQEALEKQIFGQLEAIRAIKKNQIKAFFSERQGDMGVLVDTVAALKAEGFAKLEGTQHLQKLQLENYFDERLKLMSDVQENLRYTGGIKAFTTAFASG
ncbi:MAG: hypothetical protein GQ582_11370, partial [Methyloprofundus sp.]|nr:hypothetical protein [Methyloprofundus sp.]